MMERVCVVTMDNEKFELDAAGIKAIILVSGKLVYTYDVDKHDLQTDFDVNVKVKEIYAWANRITDEKQIEKIEKYLAENLYFEDEHPDVCIINEDIIEDAIEYATKKGKVCIS